MIDIRHKKQYFDIYRFDENMLYECASAEQLGLKLGIDRIRITKAAYEILNGDRNSFFVNGKRYSVYYNRKKTREEYGLHYYDLYELVPIEVAKGVSVLKAMEITGYPIRYIQLSARQHDITKRLVFRQNIGKTRYSVTYNREKIEEELNKKGEY